MQEGMYRVKEGREGRYEPREWYIDRLHVEYHDGDNEGVAGQQVPVCDWWIRIAIDACSAM
jgi:hypothetical protein